MPVIVVTRLRLRDPALFGEFFAAAVAVTEQAENSDGNLGADVLADANNVFWTRTAWRARGPMQAFAGSEPHLATMARLDDWCDEATLGAKQSRPPRLADWIRLPHRRRPGRESHARLRRTSNSCLSRARNGSLTRVLACAAASRGVGWRRCRRACRRARPTAGPLPVPGS